MRNRKMEFFIGMMVIGIIVGVFIMTVLFGSENGLYIASGGRKMTIMFNSGGGIGQSSLVLKNGIKIGRVYSVELLDEVETASVRVSFELAPEAKIYSNEYARINRTIMGNASIEFIKDPNYKGEVYELGGDNVINGVDSNDLMSTVNSIEGDLAQAIKDVNAAAQGVALFMDNLNEFIGDETELAKKKQRVEAIFTEMAETLTSIKTLAENANGVITDEQLNRDLRAAIDKAPQILESVDRMMQGAGDMTARMCKTLDRAERTFDLVDSNLDNVTTFTTALAEQGPEAMTSLNEAAGDVRGMVQHIAQLAEDLAKDVEDPTTPLGMLGDKETATRLRRIVRNAEELTTKMHPILDDARVFSNKVAHRPSSLIWDQNTFKGGVSSGRFGLQSKTPNGGMASSLFRMTPSGARVAERPNDYYRYTPNADVNFMTPTARWDYETANAARENYRSSWLLSRFCEKIFGKRDAERQTAAARPTMQAPILSTAYATPYSESYVGTVGIANYAGYGASAHRATTANYESGASYGNANRGAANYSAAPSGVANRAPAAAPLGPYASSQPTSKPEPKPAQPARQIPALELPDTDEIEALPAAIVKKAAVSRQETPAETADMYADEYETSAPSSAANA
ncbi:MAG: MCE family protein, partial [Thermoguttaceae bacterium]|nr:MCE family protein [Thermoguttaceae bacterium]